MPHLHDFDVLTFDCYGTLIDWERGLLQALGPWLERQEANLQQDQILETYARFEAAVEAEHPTLLYPEILAEVHRRLAVEWQLTSHPDDVASFAQSVPDWPAFEDSTEALRYLGQHYRLVILSNIDRRSFQGSQKRLGVTFDAIYTAEDIGSYKPQLQNFHYMIERQAEQGIPKKRILHTAQSLFHDHVPAKQLGFTTAWIDRRQGMNGWGATPTSDGVAQPDFHFSSLAAMAEAHRQEKS